MDFSKFCGIRVHRIPGITFPDQVDIELESPLTQEEYKRFEDLVYNRAYKWYSAQYNSILHDENFVETMKSYIRVLSGERYLVVRAEPGFEQCLEPIAEELGVPGGRDYVDLKYKSKSSITQADADYIARIPVMDGSWMEYLGLR